MKKLLLASTSTIYDSNYLEYLMPTLITFFEGVQTLLFIPYARPGGISYDDYTQMVSEAFEKFNINVEGLHTIDDKQQAIREANGVFVGGGNTFVLVNKLYELDIMETIKNTIDKGTPYLGTSAGSNLAGLTMQTTNDMPIVFPPNYTTLGCIPFNINAHYIDPDPTSKHKGETRETRIKEYHTYNNIPVIGLREGSWLQVDDDKIVLKGNFSARWFQKNKKTVEIKSNTTIAI